MSLDDDMGVDLPVFDVESEDDRSRRWEEWATRLERLLAIKTVTNDALKIHYLFYFGGTDLERVFTEVGTATDKYEQVKKKIGKHFKSKVNSKLNVLHFRDIFQHLGDSFDDFVNRLKDKAKSCAFAGSNHEISLQIIHRCQSTALKRKALEAVKELEELIKYGRLDESVNSQMKELKKFNEGGNERMEVNKVRDNPGRSSGNTGGRNSRHRVNRQKTKSSYREKEENQSREEKKCFKCGLKYPHEKICPA
ncbi:Retrovirus-related Pol poly from transposon [Brachionus plicatilis]|uniref:Retrovirus-related Pol poly from transposon n=1 Tax=Brachionus plicatilis TaxID=10195 RepID=A0A3M7PHC6_BRAPC|nr:Retrovirus-related Pol poly from transposon [Brachionus plicatilis]